MLKNRRSYCAALLLLLPLIKVIYCENPTYCFTLCCFFFIAFLALEKPALDKNNKRFSLNHSKLSKFYSDEMTKCRTVISSAKDYEAVNLPFDQEYLLQNHIYKTCFLKKHNQVITLAISYRTTPDKENTLWPQDAIYRINLMTKNIILNDGMLVYDLMKFNNKEITNLK